MRRIVRRYLGFLLALLAVWLCATVMNVLHVVAWVNHAGGWAVVTGIPTPGGAPAFIHAINIMWWTLPGVVFFRWIVSWAWRARLSWAGALVLWASGGVLTLVLGSLAGGGSLPVGAAFWIGQLAVVTVGFGMTNRLLSGRGRLADG